MLRTNAVQTLFSRRNPERVLKEAYASLQEDEAVIYLVGAMEPVDSSYTKKTYEEGGRVSQQITTGLGQHNLAAEYEYQGSVTKNTHIRAYSDLDLLVIEKRFTTLEPPQQPAIPYKGDPIQDLLQIRRICISHLRSAYPKATVDDSGPRSVKISGGSLARTVDVVPSNWFDTNQYAQHNNAKVFRGVHVLNAHKPDREPDQPFVHGALINYKDGNTLGNTRKLVRLLKSLKYDSDSKVTMSSYDIESLVYRMDDATMQHPRGQEVQLAGACFLWLRKVEADQTLRESLYVPDGKRKIFAQDKATLQQLSALNAELAQLILEIDKGYKRSFKNLAEARVKWPTSGVVQL
jgi:hypothetical protein